MIDVILVLVGIVLLGAGGELLIRGAVASARRIGVSPLLTGLVIVGFGTSMPELVVSVDAAWRGQADIAVGNVVGSNIGNILLILGICALITALHVSARALSRDAVVVILAAALFSVLAIDGGLGRLDGALLLLALAGYLGWAYWSERHEQAPAAAVHSAEAGELSAVPRSLPAMVGAIVGGLALLIGGSRVLLAGAVSLAEHFGVPPTLIGLTLVAVGTSLPELTIAVLAALRRHADVAVGNILGSNIFNVLGILGVSALSRPLMIDPRILRFDQWVMLAISLVLLVLLYSGRRLSRLEGGLLLTGYMVYLTVGIMWSG